MKVKEVIEKNIESVCISENAFPVIHTCAAELGKKIRKVTSHSINNFYEGNFYIGIASDFAVDYKFKEDEHSIIVRIDKKGSGYLIASHPYLLYSYFCKFKESEENISEYKNGKVIKTAFKWNRLSYDYFISQEGRIARNVNKESYIRNAAKNGFTHIDINGLGHTMPLDNGPKGETYSMFYTYCAALDQFVYSKLNNGLYPYNYLSTNLNYAKKHAKIAVKYGMVPGFTSFEPRSVPEEFFQRYPMLRGARVDHPFRSFQPRYNMTTTHPVVLEHYAEMLRKIIEHIPELGFISIWTSDSGAGFEYLNSLYVGRNGGAYLIREWNTHEKIAEQAGKNAIRFLKNLRDAANEVNPDFRVLTRLESFYGEHDHFWNGLDKNLDIETVSLAAKGWAMPYHHPKYEDDNLIMGGSLHMQDFAPEETTKIEELRERDISAHYYFAMSTHCMFEPLMGVPYPKSVFSRLKLLKNGGVENLTNIAGTFPVEQVPYNINHEVILAFQYNPDLSCDEIVTAVAEKWAGEKYSKDLIKFWNLTDEACLAFPNVSIMYSNPGFTWYRLWARPLVPNIENIPEEDRAYYEDFMCTTPHNPNNVDLSKDVLFELTTPEQSGKNIARIRDNVLPMIEKAIMTLKPLLKDSQKELGCNNVIYDQYIRAKALKIWFTTQLNVAKWIYSVHNYQNTSDITEKKKFREILNESMNSEIENSKELKTLLSSKTEFMILIDQGETSMLYGENLIELQDKKVALMKKYFNDEPYIDPNYIMRKAAEPMM